MLLFLFRTFLSPPFRNGETMTENVIFYLSWHHHHRKVAVSVSQREIQFTECDDGVFSWIDNVGKISPNWGKARNSSGQGIIFQPTHCFFCARCCSWNADFMVMEKVSISCGKLSGHWNWNLLAGITGEGGGFEWRVPRIDCEKIHFCGEKWWLHLSIAYFTERYLVLSRL